MKTKGNLISLISVISILLVSMAMTGCGTLLYKPDESVIKSMSFQEAKNKAESLYAQIQRGGNLKVHTDHLEISGPRWQGNCYFNAMPIDITDYGPLAGGGGYPMGSRYSVSLGSGQVCGSFMFKEYQDAIVFANAAFVLKNTPLKAKESFFQALKQRENVVTIAQPAIKPDTVAIPQVISDIDELPLVKMKANKNAYAIVIGIENYRQKLPKADYAVADAKTMTEYLTKVMGYPEENVVTLTNEHAAKSDFEKYFEKWLFNNVEKDSSVFIYYSGHGAPNVKTGDAFLVPTTETHHLLNRQAIP